VDSSKIDDTFCEAFDGLFVRLLVTAADEKRVKRAAYDSTALASTVFGEAEGGIEKFLDASETPDGRPGAIIQLWVMKKKDDVEVLEIQAAKRIRQGILVVPSSSLYNAFESETKIDWMYRVGHCGDGFEKTTTEGERSMVHVPIMMGGFLIEREAGVGEGVMGGNLWFMCDSEETALKACDVSEKAVEGTEGVILSFREGCSAGSKAGGSFPHIGPTTYHNYCPTLHGVVDDHRVPEGVKAIPEMIVNGRTLEEVKAAMKAAMKAVSEIDGVIKISAGNYGGKLGKHKIMLRELLDI